MMTKMDKETLDVLRCSLIDQQELILRNIDDLATDIDCLTQELNGLAYKIDLLTQLIDEEYRREQEALEAESERQRQQASSN